MKNITQYNTVSASPLSAGGKQPSVPNFEKVGIRNKMSAWDVLERPCHRYFPGGEGQGHSQDLNRPLQDLAQNLYDDATIMTLTLL